MTVSGCKRSSYSLIQTINTIHPGAPRKSMAQMTKEEAKVDASAQEEVELVRRPTDDDMIVHQSVQINLRRSESSNDYYTSKNT